MHEGFATDRSIVLPDVSSITVSGGGTLALNGIVSGKFLGKQGNGELTLLGANTYTGKTTVNGGALTGNATSIRNDVDVSGRAAVNFDQRDNGEFRGAITGGGALRKTGDGELYLSGNNNYSGGTTIVSGALRGASNSIQGNVANSGVLVFDQASNGDFAGIISGGGGVIKTGNGKLTMSGVHTFTGATAINAGNLSVNGSLESSSVVEVNPGGTLSGNGKFGNVRNNGGTVAPGNSIGRITINGDLNMESGSTYQVELDGVESDLISVAGVARIWSSIFRIHHDTNTSAPPVLPGKAYTILTAAGGLEGQAPSIGIADFPFLSFVVSGDDNSMYLTTGRGAGAFALLASTRNEMAVANALDSAGFPSPLWQQVVGATGAHARASFTSLASASIHANAAGVMASQSHYLRDAVNDRLRQDFSPAAPLNPAMSVGSGASAVTIVDENGRPVEVARSSGAGMPAMAYAIWAQGLGAWGSMKGDGNAARGTDSLGGIISGVDLTVAGAWVWRADTASQFSRRPTLPLQAQATITTSRSMAAASLARGPCAAAPVTRGAT